METMETMETGGRREVERGDRSPASERARERLLAGLPVRERRRDLADVSTPVLEGGDGPPIVLLHGPGEHAPKWLFVIPDLTTTHRVIAPDLPGHGASVVGDDRQLDAERVLAWLDELIEQTCDSPPVVVGQIVGGAIGARFAIEHGDRIDRLVLVDSLGLAPFDPAPEFGAALAGFMEDPTDASHDRLWRHCAFDVDALRDRMGERWEPFRTYNLDRARTPGVSSAVQSLMAAFGFPAIPHEELDRIDVPTALIWGRHDLATRLTVAETASDRFGWPLHVIDDAADDPVLERPAAFLDALRDIIATPSSRT